MWENYGRECYAIFNDGAALNNSNTRNITTCDDLNINLTALNIVAFTSLAQAKNLSAGYYKFNFGSGNFLAYAEDGWVLMVSYQSALDSDPSVNYVGTGQDWPVYINRPLAEEVDCGSQIRQSVL